jgi:hypothetical protein
MKDPNISIAAIRHYGLSTAEYIFLFYVESGMYKQAEFLVDNGDVSLLSLIRKGFLDEKCVQKEYLGDPKKDLEVIVRVHTNGEFEKMWKEFFLLFPAFLSKRKTIKCKKLFQKLLERQNFSTVIAKLNLYKDTFDKLPCPAIYSMERWLEIQLEDL